MKRIYTLNDLKPGFCYTMKDVDYNVVIANPPFLIKNHFIVEVYFSDMTTSLEDVGELLRYINNSESVIIL